MARWRELWYNWKSAKRAGYRKLLKDWKATPYVEEYPTMSGGLQKVHRLDGWKTVVFSDETNIPAPTDFLLDLALKTFMELSRSIMIWGCISADGIGDVQVVERLHNPRGCIRISEDNLLPYTAQQVSDGSVLF